MSRDSFAEPSIDTEKGEQTHGDHTDNVDSNKSATDTHHTWRPSIWRVGPLAGLAALTFAFLQIFAAYGVLQVRLMV